MSQKSGCQYFVQINKTSLVNLNNYRSITEDLISLNRILVISFGFVDSFIFNQTLGTFNLFLYGCYYDCQPGKQGNE